MGFLISVIVILLVVWVLLHICLNVIEKKQGPIENLFGVIPKVYIQGGDEIF